MNQSSRQNEIRDLSALELDEVSGAKMTYYQMGKHWYAVGHDANGRATGAVRACCD